MYKTVVGLHLERDMARKRLSGSLIGHLAHAVHVRPNRLNGSCRN